MKNRRARAWRSLMYRLLNALFFLVFAVIIIVACSRDARSAPTVVAEAEQVAQPEIVYTNLVYHGPICEDRDTAAEQTEPVAVSRYADITLTAEEMDLLARIVWLEARGECFEGQQAVVEVVLNRMLSEYFPDTLTEVIYEEGQFSTVSRLHTAAPSNTQYLAIESALNGSNILPLDVVFFSVKPQNNNIWGSIGGHVFCYPWFWDGNE